MGVGDTGFLIYPICPICQWLELAGNWVDESFRGRESSPLQPAASLILNR